MHLPVPLSKGNAAGPSTYPLSAPGTAEDQAGPPQATALPRSELQLLSASEAQDTGLGAGGFAT